jgi:2'-hydroxyisoflavone reductase
MDESGPLAKYEGADAMKETQQSLRASNMMLYAPLKVESEKEAEKWFPGKTLIVRPGLIVGPGDESDRFTYWPVRVARGGEVLAPGDPKKDTVQFIDARDLAGVDHSHGRTRSDRSIQCGRAELQTDNWPDA